MSGRKLGSGLSSAAQASGPVAPRSAEDECRRYLKRGTLQQDDAGVNAEARLTIGIATIVASATTFVRREIAPFRHHAWMGGPRCGSRSSHASESAHALPGSSSPQRRPGRSPGAALKPPSLRPCPKTRSLRRRKEDSLPLS